MIDYEEDVLPRRSTVGSDIVGHPTLSDKYAIEKGIPVPDRQQWVRYDWDRSPYPFGVMEPGDSFLVPLLNGETMKHLRGEVASKCKRWRVVFNRPEVKFATRLDGNGLRVWRMK